MRTGIPLNEAISRLGLKSTSAIITSRKYNRFYHKSDKGRRNATFDLDEYLKHEALEEELLEKSKLFVEYLVHIEDRSYTWMAKFSGSSIQTMSQHNFSFDRARQLIKGIALSEPELIKRFDEYYGWRHKLYGEWLGMKYSDFVEGGIH